MPFFVAPKKGMTHFWAKCSGVAMPHPPLLLQKNKKHSSQNTLKPTGKTTKKKKKGT